MGRTAPFPAVHGKHGGRCSSQAERNIYARMKVAGLRSRTAHGLTTIPTSWDMQG